MSTPRPFESDPPSPLKSWTRHYTGLFHPKSETRILMSQIIVKYGIVIREWALWFHTLLWFLWMEIKVLVSMISFTATWTAKSWGDANPNKGAPTYRSAKFSQK